MVLKGMVVEIQGDELNQHQSGLTEGSLEVRAIDSTTTPLSS